LKLASIGSTRLEEIDALRGIAALGVAFVFHIHHLLGQARTGPLDGLPVFSWLHDYGYVLVDLFFVVSGYIFAHVYLVDGRFKGTIRDFAVARFARLYPLHLATLLVSAGLLAIGPTASAENCCNDARHFLLNLVMLQESGLNIGLSFNSPAWSISVEVLCYALFCLLAIQLPDRFWQAAVLLVAVGLLATLPGGVQLDHIARGLCGFFAGTLAYRLRKAPTGLWLVLLPAGFVLLPFASGLSIGAVLGVTSWPALVNFARLLPILRLSPLRWLGERSYSIYLTHSPVYMALNIIVFSGSAVPESLAVPMMLVGWGLVLAVSDLSYRFLETPSRRWLRRMAGDRSKPAATST
jgi:peptidoglycan/LPS O-acetylase OafA/YrhL